ncbi:unnamed protein product [Porites lobata]|uniref:DNA-directed DNA polymerase n=1 Tax=Porites lobata TaxID=104759 RepID=A0ABN8QAF5_9CNID|nr:unnamed protein product [Porites lobata]
MLHRHERTCEAKVHYTFPGGAYKTPPTIFELLEDEGFTIPPHLKYFPYRATFDFECMFNRQTGLNNTKKLTWNAKHIPLSVSVCSNVPDYDHPKCFVSTGDSKHLVKEMIDYLVEISQKSSDLMKQEFSFLFEAIDQKLEEIKQKSEQQTGESGTDVSVQEDSDDEGEDLMETDDEEEDIESETEEDRAFLDDEVESEQGASFYRALDRERENQSDDEEYVDDKPEANHPEPQKKKVHPLKKLRGRFGEYLEELPVLGFNSGKYDLNAVKEFLFPSCSIKMATEWLEWKAEEMGLRIRHQMNDTEKRIGERRLPVDGFHGPSQTVFQFHGCWWHGHNCYLTKGKEMNEKRKKPMAELREETTANSKYIRDQGYNLVEMWECQWRRMKKTNSAVQYFMNRKFHRPLDHLQTLDQNQIIKAIRDESLFGVVECDITVPDHLKPKFSEMCPIFKNTQISKEDIGEYMQTFAEEQHIMPQPRRSLIGSYFGEKILLATPLIKWYLEHGLEVTRIYQVVEYTPFPCFQPFGEAVSDARRAGDVDPNKAIIADTMKLVGNSSYGKTIKDQERHREVKFCEETKASRLINTPFFRQIDRIEDNTYEVQSCKKTVKLNLPMQIGFFVYQYAKLRMLQFYFDFLDKYLDRSDFQYCEMDTDSAYIAIAGPSVDSLVKPELRAEFQKDKFNWFPRTDTPENKAYDKRTPGLFKEEWSGEE